MGDDSNQKIIQRIDGIKSLALFFLVVSIAFIMLVVTGIGLFSAENNISLNNALFRIFLFVIPHAVIFYLAYVLYTTKKIKHAKTALLLLGVAMAVTTVLSIIDLNWFSLILYGILTIEIFNLYKKVSKLENQV